MCLDFVDKTIKAPKEAALDWYSPWDAQVIRRVKYRNPVATGKQCKRKVIVAKEMMIPEK